MILDGKDLMWIGFMLGVIVGVLTRATPENYIILSLITSIFTVFIGSFTRLVILSSAYPDWIRIPIVMIIVPFSVGFVITSVEFFRSNT